VSATMSTVCLASTTSRAQRSPGPSARALTFSSWDDPGAVRRSYLTTELSEGPIPTVLDTSCVRTGLHHQLRKGQLPASLYAAEQGRIRLFMEHETLIEAWERLPRFADQLDVPLVDLQGLFADHWLPLISVVKLPEGLRRLDPRALDVRELDPDDYPAAALACLLSPCIVLTGNHKHFAPLDVRVRTQGVDAVLAVLDLHVGKIRFQAVAMVPAAPVYAVSAATRWAWERLGPLALVILGLAFAGGVVLYRRQPPEQRETIKKAAAVVGEFLINEACAAIEAVSESEERLATCVVPGPAKRSPPAAALRTLAVCHGSMSAQGLYDALDPAVRPALRPLRAWMHNNKATVFEEVRRGSFRLGRQVPDRELIAGSADLVGAPDGPPMALAGMSDLSS
jgi:hypothetical protein